MWAIFLLFFTISFGASEAYPNTKTECWTTQNGLCVEIYDECPFKNAKVVSGNETNNLSDLCTSDGYQCCVPPPQTTSYQYNDDKCGVSHSEENFRIKNGVKVEISDFPWHAIILIDGRVHCGATLIHESWVLTAAHCVHGFEGGLWKVKLAYVSSEQNEDLIQEVDVSKTIIHPDFHPRAFPNDIALIQLSHPVKLNKYVGTACLPNAEEAFEDIICTATGMGVTATGSPSNSLQEVSLPVVSLDKCRESWKRFINITHVVDKQLCAGFVSGGRDACKGDSGGPFVCRKLDKNNKKKWILAGIISFSAGCGEKNIPGIYTRVSKFMNWIQSVTKVNF